MVGLSDIPCVGKIVDRISDATVDPLFRGFSYMFSYKDHVAVLNSEIRKLNTETDRMSRKVGEERDNGKILIDEVGIWQTEVEEIQRSAKEFQEKYKYRSSWRCIQCMPIPQPISRFRLGREALQKAKRATELSDSAKDLLANEIAYLSPVENAPATDTIYHNFESRNDAYEKLWEALTTEGSSLILGIYGMPGVGKTRMMEQIWKEAKDKKIFDKVTRADVGNEKLDVIKLQNQIAGHLNCHFESQNNEELRASQLRNSLMNGGKILIILDDVWWQIPLHRIGIPLGNGSSSKHCKILLTSRKENVCLVNKCMHPVKITPLKFGEAWNMFRDTVGTDSINLLQDESLAQKVCKKCAGLPLLIRAVGKALQFTSHYLWKDALYQLEKGNFENIADMDPEVYACVKFSIERLPDDAKSCLFLCSLYPEDDVIYFKKLIALARGSQFVPDGESRICAMVHVLRSSSLLLDSEDDHKIKLHDLIRDVAGSMAVKDPKYAFLTVKCGLQWPENADYCTRKLLYLHLEKNYFCFPDDLVCPNLHILWLQCHRPTQHLSGGFFGMFANLRFLLIETLYTSLDLQFSLQPLNNLMTLILDGCDMTYIDQTNVSFFPEKLETLCIWDCHLPVPLALPNLKHLKKLEIRRWLSNINVQMVPNTISSMPSLEELHIPGGYKIGDDVSETSLDAVSPSILVEISKLTKLKSLQMWFPRDAERFQDLNIFGNLLEFNISVGDALPCNLSLLRRSSVSIKRSIVLHGDHIELEGLKGLIERAEDVKLVSTHINVGNIYNSNNEAFTDLTAMYIQNCHTMENLARTPHYEIQHRRSFSKLTILEIKDCSAMKYLFNNSVAKCLTQLQTLSIERCSEMEAVIMNEGTSDGDDNDVINFSKLKSLRIAEIPRLKRFCMKKKDMHSGSTPHKSAISAVQVQPLFDEMVAFPHLEDLELDNAGEKASRIWGDCNNIISASFHKLRDLCVCKCDELETLIPLAMSISLRNLESVSVTDCKSLRNVFQHSSITRHLIHLKEIKILNCHRLKNVFQHSSIARNLVHLQVLRVSRCKMITEIIGGEGGEQEEKEDEITNANDGIVVFPELTTLILSNLQCLTSLWYYKSGEAIPFKVQFPNLVDLDLYECSRFNSEMIELGRDDSNCQLRTVSMTCNNKLQLSCKWKLRLYNLERLSLPRYHWWHELKFQCFKRLKVLMVTNSGCSNLSSLSVFGSLHQLQGLYISRCNSLKEIVEDARGVEPTGTYKKTVTLFQLKSVFLQDLPNLQSCFHGENYEWHMPALEVVRLNNCGISTLFTCSVFRTLQQLSSIKVSNCILLEGIVEDARGHETYDTSDKIITLPQLLEVNLEGLPNLKSFSSTSIYTLNMPKLQKFSLHRCPLIENFTSLETSTPMVMVCSDWHEWRRYPDLNDYIRENCKRQDNLSNSVGESSYSNQELETEPESVGEKQLQQTEENDQP